MSRSAAVDIGTNSVRLLVAGGDGEVDRRNTITRLGQGVDAAGHLADEAIERTLEVLVRYRDRWRELGVEDARVRITATSAVRDSSDRSRFEEAVVDAVGVPLDVISGDEEARLTFRGVVRRLEVRGPTLVMDIGGGSTEFVAGRAGDGVDAAVSLQLGSVRLTERLLPSDPPTAEEVEAARTETDQRLAEAVETLRDRGAVVGDGLTMVGVAGTVTTVAALALGLEEYDADRIHGSRLGRRQLADWAERLRGLTAAQRADLGPVDPGRADVIAAGALIAVRAVAAFGVEELLVSEADILDGILASVHDRAAAARTDDTAAAAPAGEGDRPAAAEGDRAGEGARAQDSGDTGAQVGGS